MGSFKASIGNTQARMTDFLDDLRKCNPLGGGGGTGACSPGKFFLDFNSPKTLSWVSESFRQDIYWLSKPLSRFQLGKFCFLLKTYMKNLTDFRKTVENGMPDPHLNSSYLEQDTKKIPFTFKEL